MTDTLSLPAAIAAHFAADPSDGASVATCFTEDAVVVDEARTHVGRAAIIRWKQETAAKFSYTSTPLAVRDDEGRLTVVARVSGTFPGSPIDLTYRFTLAESLIAHLEIVP